MGVSSSSNRKVAVIGAGAVGMSTAVHLQRDGHDVTVIDRDDPGQGCSFGNAGLLCPGYVVPLSMPGAAWKVPGWLMDPLGPLSIRWRDFPSLIPWFLRFLAAGNQDETERSAKGLAALHENCVRDFKALFDSIGAGDMIVPTGYAYVYETDKALKMSTGDCEMKEAYGRRFERLSGDAIREIEPALSEHCVGGIYMPDEGQVKSPLAVVEALAEHFVKQGGRILKREVKDIEIGPDGPRKLVLDDGNHDLDVMVVAAGAWSGKLSARLGSPVPLVGERGYHLTLPNPGVTPKIPLMSGEGHFAMTPMQMGLRVAGTAEFASLDAPPNYSRAKVLATGVKRLLPGVETEGSSEWMGMRPTLPDTLPVIGPSPRFPDTYFAFGHGHAGLMGSVITGRTIADLVSARTPELDISLYKADRF